MEIAENIVLVIAVLWVIWQVLSLRDRVFNGGEIIPPEITSLLIFMIFMALVVALPISSLNLIWLFVLSIVLGLITMTFPLGQTIGMGFLFLLSMTGKVKDGEEEE